LSRAGSASEPLGNQRGNSRRRLKLAWAFALALAAALVFPSASGAHAERSAYFPDYNLGSFPEYRTDGPNVVVCKRESRRLIQRQTGDLRRENMRLLKRCRFNHIQAAVDSLPTGQAGWGHRIFVLPGTYREEPSLDPPAPECVDIYARANGNLSYGEQLRCPNAQNLIAILGDTNPNNDSLADASTRTCDSRCNLQIEGTGARPEDVLITGDEFSTPGVIRRNGIRADRADGIFLKNFTIEFFHDNGVYALETNGFRFDGVVARYVEEYPFLTFTSDHGIYENCEAYGGGDAGIYPGSGPNLHGNFTANHPDGYGIIIRNCDSHDNALGYSGTAGNGVWVHHNKFHHNTTGLTTDSFVPNHPGMPQDFSKWSENLIYSNNWDLYTAENDARCTLPPSQRSLRDVCPSNGTPVGTGQLIGGGNSNLIQSNYFFDNWRLGAMLFWVPATFRGDDDPSRQNDTSNNNRYEGNCMGVRPAVLDPSQVDFTTCSGTPDPNGVDFWWDEEEGVDCVERELERPDPGDCVDAQDGLGNCWVQSPANGDPNVGPGGAPASTDPLVAPDCPGIDVPRQPPTGTAKSAMLAPCATWTEENRDPPGCQTPAGQTWFEAPPEP
jgi:hypothetical protein